MAITRRTTDVNLMDRFDLSDFKAPKPPTQKQLSLKDIWYALDGLPAIRVTPDMVIARFEEKHQTEYRGKLSQDHRELKEICWQAIEQNPEGNQQLKQWLLTHQA